MNRACKYCIHHEYNEKEKPFGMGFHWCNKYNDAISDVKDCVARIVNSNNQKAFKRKNKMIFAAY